MIFSCLANDEQSGTVVRVGVERNRALSAMVELGEFTAASLAEFAGVKEATVRTILDREGELLEPFERITTGRPGGRPWRYRLRSGAADRIAAELGALPRFPGTAAPALAPPPELLVAETQLLTVFPRAGSSEREMVINFAGSILDDVAAFTGAGREPALARGADGAVIESRPRGPAPAGVEERLATALWLVKLAEAEVAVADAEIAEESGPVVELAEEFARGVWPFIRNPDAPKELVSAVLKRVLASPVLAHMPWWKLCPPGPEPWVLVDLDERVAGAVRATLDEIGRTHVDSTSVDPTLPSDVGAVIVAVESAQGRSVVEVASNVPVTVPVTAVARGDASGLAPEVQARGADVISYDEQKNRRMLARVLSAPRRVINSFYQAKRGA